MLPGCSFTFENDKYIDSETGKFFTGNDVSIHCKISGALRPYVEQGITGGVVIYKPMYIKKSVDNPNNYIILSSRDDEMQFDSSFLMQGTIYIQAVFQVIVDRGLTYIKVGFCGQSDSRNGSVSIFSAEMGINYIESNNGSEAAVKAGRKVVLMAAVNPRYFFAGWYADSSATQFISSEPVFEIDGSRVVANTPMYYARYLPSQDSVMSQWNANEGDVKDFLWQSKVFSASSYFSMTSIAVYADNYPVELKFFYSSSPMNIFGDSGNSASIIIYNQNAVRLPKMRPEKYFAFQVKGNARINHVAIGSSMEAIR